MICSKHFKFFFFFNEFQLVIFLIINEPKLAVLITPETWDEMKDQKGHVYTLTQVNKAAEELYRQAFIALELILLTQWCRKY